MLFIKNKYTKTYNQIINNARNRVLPEGTYTEVHHSIPTSLGGPNIPTNRVELTAREHFICHWLLVKMTEKKNRIKMVYALQYMKSANDDQQRYENKTTARVYEHYRIEHAKNHSETMKGTTPPNKGRKMSEEQKQKLRDRAKANHASGKMYSEESQQKRIAKVLGRKASDETKLKQSLALKGIAKGPMSEEGKLKRSLKQKGVEKTNEHAENIRKATLGNVSINKDGQEKKVKRDILQSYLDQGWALGGKKRK